MKIRNFASAVLLFALTTTAFAQKFENLAATPPMGWNSWNGFGCNVDEKLIRATADAISANGMKDAGYQYVVVDDCWHGVRNAQGSIEPMQSVSFGDEGPRRLHPFQRPEVRHLFRRRCKDMRRPSGKPRPRISGRSAPMRRGASTTSSTTGATARI